MARAFGRARGRGEVPFARRSRGGDLTVFENVDQPTEEINVPTAYGAVQFALAQDGAGMDLSSRYGSAYPPTSVSWTAPSNEARYLTGVLGLAGGLARTAQFLLHPFLREKFCELGGAPNPPAVQVEPTINRLNKLSRKNLNFSLDTDRVALATLIVRAARAIGRPREFLKYDDLKASWDAYRKAFWAEHPRNRRDEDEALFDSMESESLDDCLRELRNSQILFQGHRWTCRKCHNRNWVDISELSPELLCQVCKQKTSLPVNFHWLFRASEFLIESLRDHSVLSLVWTLDALRARARRSFIFVEPTWFGFSREAESPDAEADLIVLVDGEVVLCEVKSSWASVRPNDLVTFVELAIRTRPDIALFAVMDGAAQSTSLGWARGRLEECGIKFELLTLNDYKPSDDPMLRFGQ
jgi:hypothetical protein